MKRILILAISVFSTLHAATLSDTCRQATWETNGIVRTILPIGDKVYIGGEFTYVGPHTGSGLPINTITGSVLPVYPRVDGSVLAVVADGKGGWFIGGTFTKVEGNVRNNLAHVLADGRLDLNWNPNANGPVMSLVVNGATVYVGGWFSSIGGQPRKNLAALDTVTGMAISWNPNANFGVTTLAVNNTTVYASGNFDSIGGQARNHLAALDRTTGLATSWNPNTDGSGLTNILSLAINDTTVYVGGEFNSIGGQLRGNLAALDATTGLVTSWNPNASAGVLSLAVNGAMVYAGGKFSSIGGQTRNRIAALDAVTGLATNWNPNVNKSINSIVVNGATVYIGGWFDSIGVQTRKNLAAIDAATGLATSWNPQASSEVLALAVNGASVYAGGSFSSIGGQTRNRIAALDAATGLATSWNPNAGNPENKIITSTVRSIAVNGATVYIAGTFSNVGGNFDETLRP